MKHEVFRASLAPEHALFPPGVCHLPLSDEPPQARSLLGSLASPWRVPGRGKASLRSKATGI